MSDLPPLALFAVALFGIIIVGCTLVVLFDHFVGEIEDEDEEVPRYEIFPPW